VDTVGLRTHADQAAVVPHETMTTVTLNYCIVFSK